MRICFYANVVRDEITKIEFYGNDVRILEELGHEVVVAETAFDLFRVGRVDLYYVWWWNRALLPIVAGRLTSAKTVVCGVFDYFVPYRSRHDYVSRPRWQRWLMRTALAKADANIFICQYEFELVQRFLNVRNPCMIYLAIDAERYAHKRNASAGKKLLNIAWAGEENARRKGLFEIIRAMPAILKEHPDATLVMAGRRGPALETLRHIAVELKVEHAVKFAGEVSLEDKVRYMQEAALYLQPSMFEGFGSAVAEAMACGTPAAYTLAGSLPEVAATTGVQLLSARPENIAEAVNNFLSQGPLQQKMMGDAAAQRVREMFSFESRKTQMRQQLDQLFT